LECLLAEEVAFAQRANELLLERVLRTNRDPNLTLRDDKESVAACALPDDVVAFLVVALLEHVGYLDERIFGKVFEDGNAVRGKKNARKAN
jgi:hypothetical protein